MSVPMFATLVTRVTQVVCQLGTVQVNDHAREAETRAEKFAIELVTK
jgi:hypothetical protein